MIRVFIYFSQILPFLLHEMQTTLKKNLSEIENQCS